MLNENARQFYHRHGVVHVEPAAESGVDLLGEMVMTCKYCLRYELDLCGHRLHNEGFTEPLYLVDAERNRLRLLYDCRECAKGSGYIYSKQGFGSCQLHVEFRSTTLAVGTSQGRSNSGVFLMNLYEVQVLDSYQNKTYSDGQCSAIYRQYPPLVNASLPGNANTLPPDKVVQIKPELLDRYVVLEHVSRTKGGNQARIRNPIQCGDHCSNN